MAKKMIKVFDCSNYKIDWKSIDIYLNYFVQTKTEEEGKP